MKTKGIAVLISAMLLLGMGLAGCLTGGSGGGSTAYSADVIIVGAGGAGMSAAIAAHDAGASVILIEKSGVTGGNTIPAQAGVNASESNVQVKLAGVANAAALPADQKNAAFLAYQQATDDLAKPELVRFMVENSGATIDWLVETAGMEFKQTTRLMHYVDRGVVQIGVGLGTALSRTIEQKGIRVDFNTRATSLVLENGEVVGVSAINDKNETVVYNGKAVVLATGGFGRNEGLIGSLKPEWKGKVTTDEIAPTTGDGLLMAMAIGAAAVDLQYFHTAGTVSPESHEMILNRNGSVIMVNKEGKRYKNETVTENPNTPLEPIAQTDGLGFVIFDKSKMEDASSGWRQQHYNKGIVEEADTLEALAGKIGVNAAALKSTVDTWNGYFDANLTADPEFRRDISGNNGPASVTGKINNPPYYAIPFKVGVHYCMGGLVIDTQTRVYDINGEVIPGLFAAGEVSGGVHGKFRVEGSAVTDTVVYGRQAGLQTANYAKTK